MNGGRDIKSTAVVKFNAATAPSHYAHLAQDTNINAPPSNWLRGKFGAQEPWIPGQAGNCRDFSSFAMGNNFLDYVGRVDVMSEAENVKKIMKIPYSSAPLSMMVHRIGNTLFIDNFDVYRHILCEQKSDWKWLQKFICEHVVKGDSSHQNSVVPVVPQGENLDDKMMLSKFLYHSVQNTEKTDEIFPLGSPELKRHLRHQKNVSSVLPDPLESASTDTSGSPRSEPFVPHFERQVLWTFEDIRMLVGADMPIFGGGTHPCVSLRLRDMLKPINILTGLDYWLDQLMCNVPEVVMCYHLEGIVQKYEFVKTEDLPTLGESPFSPELIRDVAQNILSFLKSNATREGHTYWLLKAKDDDVVKLYDLTTICPEYMDLGDANPFTVPVAVLMYKVARNLSEHAEKNPRKAAGTVYKLLNDTLELLNKEKFPQIVGSVHYLLANLYLNYGLTGMNGPGNSTNVTLSSEAEVAPDSGINDDSFDGADWLDDFMMPIAPSSGASETSHCVTLDMLIRREPQCLTMPALTAAGRGLHAIPNCSNLEDCCAQALEHIYEGFECAEVLDKCRERSSSVNSADDDERRSRPNPVEAIPLIYEPISKQDAALLPLAVRKPLATGWKLELTALLMVKALTAYHLLGECGCKLQNYGKALRYVKQCFLCYESCVRMISELSNPSATLLQCEEQARASLPDILTLCGDIHLMLAHQDAFNLSRHIRDYRATKYRDTTLAAKAWKLLGSDSELAYSWCTDLSDSIEENLQLSWRSYECALKEVAGRVPEGTLKGTTAGEGHRRHRQASGSSGTKKAATGTKTFEDYVVDSMSLTKRLGNVKNEIGVYYMNLASTVLAKQESSATGPSDTVQAYWQKSYASFLDGINLFEKIGDKGNIALLYSNCGRLMRLCAFSYVETDKEFTEQERHYYQRAVEMYQKSLDHVSPKTEHLVWESVSWELSSAYFAFATQLQERPPLKIMTAAEIEKDISELMQKALRLVDTIDSPDGAKHAVYAYRAAVIHRKLAAMHHRAYRTKEGSERRVKQLRNLAELHYARSSDLYREMLCESESALEFIRVQLERVAMTEYTAEALGGSSARLKLLQQAVSYVLSCHSAFVMVSRQKSKYLPKTTHSDGDKALKVDSTVVEHDAHSQRSSNGDENARKCGTAATAAQTERELFFEEVQTLCSLALARLQALTKTMFMLAKTTKFASSEEGASVLDECKKAYAATLVPEPKDVVHWPAVVIAVIEKLWNAMPQLTRS